MVLKNFLIILLLFITVSNADSSQNLIDNIKAQPNLKTLSYLVSSIPPGQISYLTDGRNDFTIFAPSDDGIHNDELEIFRNYDTLENLIFYHIVPGSFPTSSLKSLHYLPTLLNVTDVEQILVISNKNEINMNYGIQSILNGPAKIVTPDIQASNGYIHIIDRVLRLPETLYRSLQDSKNYSAFTNALGNNDVISNAENVTVFIPVDKVFSLASKSSKNIINSFTIINSTIIGYLDNLTNGLKLKNLNGQEINVSIELGIVYLGGIIANKRVKIILPDILLSNGVAHVVDFDTYDHSSDSNSFMNNLIFSISFTSFTFLFFIFLN